VFQKTATPPPRPCQILLLLHSGQSLQLKAPPWGPLIGGGPVTVGLRLGSHSGPLYLNSVQSLPKISQFSDSQDFCSHSSSWLIEVRFGVLLNLRQLELDKRGRNAWRRLQGMFFVVLAQDQPSSSVSSLKSACRLEFNFFVHCEIDFNLE
jgi:hypothetical protein